MTILGNILFHVQNRILHNRLEALHIRLAEQERGIAGLSSQRTDSHGEDDLHGVVSYLRRSIIDKYSTHSKNLGKTDQPTLDLNVIITSHPP